MRHRRREDRAASEKGLPGAGGYREHDILIVTEDEAEHLTRFPFGPEHNVVGAQDHSEVEKLARESRLVAGNGAKRA